MRLQINTLFTMPCAILLINATILDSLWQDGASQFKELNAVVQWTDNPRRDLPQALIQARFGLPTNEKVHRDRFACPVFSENSKLALATLSAKTCIIWDTRNSRIVGSTEACDSAIRTLAFDPSGRQFLTGHMDGTLRLWSTDGFQRLWQARLSSHPIIYANINTPTTVLCIDSANRVIVWDVAKGRELVRKRLTTASRSLVSNLFVGALNVGQLQLSNIWEIDDEYSFSDVKRMSSAINAIASSNDGRLLTVALSDRHTGSSIVVFDKVTERKVLEVSSELFNGERAECVALARAGQTCVWGTADGNLWFWDLYASTRPERLRLKQGGLIRVACANDGSLVLCGHDSGMFTVVRLPVLSDVHGSENRTPGDFNEHWRNLSSGDLVSCYKALYCIVNCGDLALSKLDNVVRPVAIASGERIGGLVARLRLNAESLRVGAYRELMELGQQCIPVLRMELDKDLRANDRDYILRCIKDVSTVPEGHLRLIRAIQAMEYIGTDKALRLLRRMSEGPEYSSVTREARASIGRLIVRVE